MELCDKHFGLCRSTRDNIKDQHCFYTRSLVMSQGFHCSFIGLEIELQPIVLIGKKSLNKNYLKQTFSNFCQKK